MFGKKKEEGDGKKKKGCLRRLLGMVFGAVAVMVVLALLLDDDTEYISEEEQNAAQSEDDVNMDDLISAFFDWYGYIPEDDDSYNFMDNTAYADYDYDYYDDYYDDYYGYDDEYGYDDYGSDDYYGYGYGDDYDDYYGDDYYNDDYYGYGDDSYDDYYGNGYGDDDYYDKEQETETKKDTTSDKKPDSGLKPKSDLKPKIPTGSKPTQKITQKPSTDSGQKPKTTEKKNTTPASQRREQFVKCAESYMGTPYVFGGTSRSGIDCSGLVYLAAQDAGLGTLPRTAKTMYNIASSINKDSAEKGDLVFFATDSNISHVAIYLGDNTLLHAISEGSKTGVVTSKLTSKYWKTHYYGMGRIISDEEK